MTSANSTQPMNGRPRDGVLLREVLSFLTGVGRTGRLVGGDPGEPPFEVWIADGQVVEAVWGSLRGLGALEVAAIFLPRANFVFAEGVRCESPALAITAADVARILEEVSREAATIDRLVPGLGAVPVRAVPSDGLDQDESTLARVDGQRTVGELAEGGSPLQVVRALAALAERGLIVFGTTSQAVTAPPARVETRVAHADAAAGGPPQPVPRPAESTAPQPAPAGSLAAEPSAAAARPAPAPPAEERQRPAAELPMARRRAAAGSPAGAPMSATASTPDGPQPPVAESPPRGPRPQAQAQAPTPTRELAAVSPAVGPQPALPSAGAARRRRMSLALGPRSRVRIALVALGLLGAMMIAVIGISAFRAAPAPSTPTTITLHERPPVVLATPVEPARTVPLAVPSPQQQAAPLAVPSPQGAPIAAASPSASAAGRLLLDVRFADGAIGWPNSGNSTAWADQLGYHLEPRVARRHVAVAAPLGQDLDNTDVAGTFHKSGGPAGGGYGLILRAQGSELDGLNQGGRYYVFEVGDLGQIGIWRRDEDAWFEFLPWTTSAAVQPGTAENRLEVRAVGAAFTFTVNGAQVAQTTDTALAKGAVGVFTGGDGNQVVLQRFTVTSI